MSGLKNRRAFIHLALSLMTACWMTGLLRALLGDAGPSASLTVVVLTLLTLVPLELSRWAHRLDLRQNLHRGVMGGAFVFFALLLVSSGFYNDYGLFGAGWLNRLMANELSGATFVNQSTSLALVALCWWMGLTLGDMLLTSASLLRYFYVCLSLLVMPSAFFVFDVIQSLSWLYFVFLFAALMALGLGRVEEAARRSQSRGSPFTFYWLAQIGLTSGVLLGLVGLAQVLGLAQGLGLIIVVISPLLVAMIYPLAFVGAKAIAFGLSLAAESSSPGMAEAPDLATAGSSVVSTSDPASPQNVCIGIVILLFSLFAVYLIAYGARRWQQLLKDQEQDEREALPSLGQQLSGVLDEQLERLGFNLPGLGHLRRRLAARSIRRMYVALVALGAERGYPRSATRTPYEHRWALKQALPSCEVQVERITEAYVAAHYGEIPETREALREIGVAWEQVRETARRMAPVKAAAAEKRGNA